MRKAVVISAAVLVLAGYRAAGDPMRPLLTRENRFPEPLRAEVGVSYAYLEYGDHEEAGHLGDSDRQELAPYVRVALAEGLAAWVRAPYRRWKPDTGTGTDGMGDVTVGIDLRAFGDVFGYPYIVPHASVQFDTGDEAEGLGEGDTVPELGISVGTVVMDRFHFIADGSYRIYEHKENIAMLSASLIWDVDSRLSLLAEVRGTTEEVGQSKGHPGTFLGGLCYRVSDQLEVAFYGGGAKNAPQDVIAETRISWSF
ncbi:MAG TPA: hypothetical protein EYP62_05355 [Kiritimatiellae bacterium]|nr:hypothetical protein [Kiritimatiellia bacterium]